jgi:hypothetical protein
LLSPAGELFPVMPPKRCCGETRNECPRHAWPPASGNRADRSSFAKQSSRTKSGATAFDFAAVNAAALASFPTVLARILPGGKHVGAELVALNPRRADRRLGSFKVNRYNGCWADFATGDKGGDPISLVAYLADVSQGEAPRLLARMLGFKAGVRR